MQTFMPPPGTTTFLDNEKTLQLRPRDVRAEEWAALLGQEVYSAQGHILSVTLEVLVDRDFELADLIAYIADDANWPTTAESSRNALAYKLDDYRRTNLFSSKGLKVRDLLKQHTCSVLALRELRNEDKSLITAVIARSLFDVFGRYHNIGRRRRVSFKGPLGTMARQNAFGLSSTRHMSSPRAIAFRLRATPSLST